MEELIATHNAQRALKGLAPLEFNSQLSQAAQGHADWMWRNRKLSHRQGWFGKSLAARVEAAGYRYRGIGENIAAGQQDNASVMSAWMKSSGHRANILGNFEHLGVGRADDYWCVVFGRQ
jgi:uncharacterized protein YkwD